MENRADPSSTDRTSCRGFWERPGYRFLPAYPLFSVKMRGAWGPDLTAPVFAGMSVTENPWDYSASCCVCLVSPSFMGSGLSSEPSLVFALLSFPGG